MPLNNQKENKQIKVLSCFDGMSVAQQAISELYKDYEYYASEIDEYAIAVTQSNFQKTIQLGNVQNVYGREKCLVNDSDTMWEEPGTLSKIDLLIGGSPCQDLSIAKKDRKGLDGKRSGLFYEYVRIRDEVKPKYFILENVASMSKESKDKISNILGVQPVMINASLVSAQNRKRLFWVGRRTDNDNYEQVYVPQPEDKGILLKDVLEQEVGEQYNVGANFKFGNSQGNKVYKSDGKSRTLMALGGGGGAKTGLYAVPVALRNRGKGKKPEYNGTGKANAMTSVQTDSMVEVEQQIRKLTPVETLRLQSMPDNYFDKAIYKDKPISNTQKYKMCGNAFNCAVIRHILLHLDIK